MQGSGTAAAAVEAASNSHACALHAGSRVNCSPSRASTHLQRGLPGLPIGGNAREQGLFERHTRQRGEGHERADRALALHKVDWRGRDVAEVAASRARGAVSEPRRRPAGTYRASGGGGGGGGGRGRRQLQRPAPRSLLRVDDRDLVGVSFAEFPGGGKPGKTCPHHHHAWAGGHAGRHARRLPGVVGMVERRGIRP